MEWGRKWLVDFDATCLFDRSDNTGAIDVKMNRSVLQEKPSFKIMGLFFPTKLDWGSYTISISKTASKNIEPLVRSVKFLSPEVALYLFKYTIWPYMKYCCLVRVVAPSC